MKYIYGPVKSRRLGFSLGLSLTPYKTCDFDCLYCQLGMTTDKTVERKEYLKIEEITGELKGWFLNNPQEADSLEYITLSGSGEPTLNIKIGELISEIRKITNRRIAVITNASLLSDAGVRRELLGADLVVPSLDSVIPEVFARVDRPQQGLKIEEIIEGLISFRKEFRGKIWLEVMLISGVNDRINQIRKLKEAVDKINPDKIQLNSPVRSSPQEKLLPLDKGKLKKVQEILGHKCEII